MQVFEPYMMQTDSRGLVCGITRQEWVREVNYIETVAGEVRGNHYHRETIEMFFIIEGAVRVTARHLHSGHTEERVFSKGDIFLIEPYELHTFRVMEDAKWINMLSKPMAGTTPDLHQCRHDQPGEARLQ
jgi:dTDP-4-dehydrorhamnose 3,5-epimerase-like enzyme